METSATDCAIAVLEQRVLAASDDGDASLNAARYFAADSMGTVSVRNVADPVLLNADPLANIRNTLQVDAVILRGKLIDRTARAALLNEARRRGIR